MSRQGNDKDGMRPIGDIIKMSNLPKRIKRESRLMLAAGEIHDLTTLERDDVSYWPRGLVQCTLPYSNPGNVRAYVRRSGNYFLMIEPGTKIDRKTGALGTNGFPYGSYPRLVCSYIALEVRLKRSRRVFLGDSLSSFMAELGLVPTGGRWGTITNLRKQIVALVNAKIAFGYAGDENFDAGGHQLFADEWALWWDENKGSIEQGSLFPNYIDISEKLAEDLAKSFPVDMAILKALKQSSLALDLYAWATSKVYGLKSATAIPWTSMHAQFGSAYTGPHGVRDFRAKAVKHLRTIKALYPDFRYELTRGRILILPSNPSVLPMPPRD